MLVKGKVTELLGKYSKMEFPDCIYNWLVDFFRAHTRCSGFGGMESEFIVISACIIQASAAGVASYVTTGSDLRPITPGRVMVKFADDTWLSGFPIVESRIVCRRNEICL